MKIGVIGTGVMGKNHLRVYSSLSERCQVVGVYDIDYKRAKLVADEFCTVAYNTLDDLLKHVDAVSIAVPTVAHFDVGSKCLDQKVHVLMEKPITETVAEAKKLICKANNAGLKLQVGHIELFNPTINVLQRILADQEIIALDIHRMKPLEPRNQNVDVVKDLMIHDIYTLLYLLKDSIDNVYAIGRSNNAAVKHAIALFRFRSGNVAQLTASHVAEEKVRTIRVIAKKAFINADLLGRKIVVTRPDNSQQTIVEKIAVPEQDPLKMQLLQFINCIENNAKPAVTGEDGLLALSVTDKINQILWNS